MKMPEELLYQDRQGKLSGFPVIPTFNATVEEIQAIAAFADTLPGVEELQLLSVPTGWDRIIMKDWDGNI